MQRQRTLNQVAHVGERFGGGYGRSVDLLHQLLAHLGIGGVHFPGHLTATPGLHPGPVPPQVNPGIHGFGPGGSVYGDPSGAPAPGSWDPAGQLLHSLLPSSPYGAVGAMAGGGGNLAPAQLLHSLGGHDAAAANVWMGHHAGASAGKAPIPPWVMAALSAKARAGLPAPAPALPGVGPGNPYQAV